MRRAEVPWKGTGSTRAGNWWSVALLGHCPGPQTRDCGTDDARTWRTHLSDRPRGPHAVYPARSLTLLRGEPGRRLRHQPRLSRATAVPANARQRWAPESRPEQGSRSRAGMPCPLRELCWEIAFQAPLPSCAVPEAGSLRVSGTRHAPERDGAEHPEHPQHGVRSADKTLQPPTAVDPCRDPCRGRLGPPWPRTGEDDPKRSVECKKGG